jgi:hypothetical protein
MRMRLFAPCTLARAMREVSTIPEAAVKNVRRSIIEGLLSQADIVARNGGYRDPLRHFGAHRRSSSRMESGWAFRRSSSLNGGAGLYGRLGRPRQREKRVNALLILLTL